MANNVLINVQGLLEGKRVRKLPLKARLYFPLLLGLSNTFARLELDYELLADKLASFHDPDADAASIAEWFREFEKVKLAFIYDGHNTGAEEPTRWAQFDTPAEYRRSYPTKEDNDSPAPLEPAYTEWLKAIHGAEWEQYHLTKYQRERKTDISAKRSEAGRKGGVASGANRRSKQTEANGNSGKQTEHDADAVVGEVVDEDVEEDDDTGTHALCIMHDGTKQNGLSIHNSKSNNSSNGTMVPVESGANAKSPTPVSASTPQQPAAFPLGSADKEIAEWLAETFHALVLRYNKQCKPQKIIKNWRKVWASDFAKLLAGRDLQQVMELIIFSQTPTQAEFNVRPAKLLEHAELLERQIQKLKKANKWSELWRWFEWWLKRQQAEDVAPVAGNSDDDELDDIE
jgi:hypothetical protein